MKQSLFIRILLLLVCAVSSQGQNLSWFQSAHLQPEGAAEIVPSACYYVDGGVFRPAWGINYGMQFIYGASDRLNVTVRTGSYGHVFEGQRVNFGYLGCAPTFGIIPDRLAISIPVGMNLSEYFNVQADVKLHISLYAENGFNLTVSPSVDVFGGAYSSAGLGSDFTVGIPLGKRSTQLVLESGAYVWPGSGGQGFFFGGLGLRQGIWQ
jgi:hypothetical protein